MDPFQSVINNNVDNVRKLVRMEGFDFNSLDEHGKSLLDYAVANQNVEIATLLRDQGANVTHKSELLEQLLVSTEILISDYIENLMAQRQFMGILYFRVLKIDNAFRIIRSYITKRFVVLF